MRMKMANEDNSTVTAYLHSMIYYVYPGWLIPVLLASTTYIAVGVTKLMLGSFGGLIFLFGCDPCIRDTNVRKLKVILCRTVIAIDWWCVQDVVAVLAGLLIFGWWLADWIRSSIYAWWPWYALYAWLSQVAIFTWSFLLIPSTSQIFLCRILMDAFPDGRGRPLLPFDYTLP